MKTGFKDLDEIIKVNKGGLIVVASRPAMGKSTFVLNILSHIALEENKNDITDLIIAKNFDGKLDTIKVAWMPEYCMFGNTIVI